MPKLVLEADVRTEYSQQGPREFSLTAHMKTVRGNLTGNGAAQSCNSPQTRRGPADLYFLCLGVFRVVRPIRGGQAFPLRWWCIPHCSRVWRAWSIPRRGGMPSLWHRVWLVLACYIYSNRLHTACVWVARLFWICFQLLTFCGCKVVGLQFLSLPRRQPRRRPRRYLEYTIWPVLDFFPQSINGLGRLLYRIEPPAFDLFTSWLCKRTSCRMSRTSCRI